MIIKSIYKGFIVAYKIKKARKEILRHNFQVIFIYFILRPIFAIAVIPFLPIYIALVAFYLMAYGVLYSFSFFMGIAEFDDDVMEKHAKQLKNEILEKVSMEEIMEVLEK